MRGNVIGAQGACGTCPSSAGTMKMGIERALQARSFPARNPHHLTAQLRIYLWHNPGHHPH